MSSSWITKTKRLAIYLRDGFTCAYCGLDLHHADPRDVTLDHLTPRIDGGSNKPSNLITACLSCNSSKQDKPWTQFAGPMSQQIIRRNIRRSMAKHLALAKAIIAGDDSADRKLEAK